MFDHADLYVVYQPIYNRMGKVVKLEALLRTRSGVSTCDYIKDSEIIGDIDAVTYFVMNQVCFDMAKMRQWWARPIVAVNMPPSLIEDNKFVAKAIIIMDQCGLTSGEIEIEITESPVEKRDDLQYGLSLLSEYGCRLLLDDFGTRSSGFVSLQQYPIKSIKIDRHFISGLGSCQKSREIVTSIVNLARNIDITTIAEGVETEDQLAIAKDLGCDMFQGFLLKKPMLLDEMTLIF